MTAWEERPAEVANLLNPAFCGLLLRATVLEYTKTSAASGMDFPLAFLVLPIVLHKPTREAMPRTAATKFHAWLQQHQALRIGFSTRVQQLAPITREALQFTMQRSALALDSAGLLVAPTYNFRRADARLVSPIMTECRKKATFLGKWLGKAGSASQILSAWGITV